jgi:nucleoid DNA-binding protein
MTPKRGRTKADLAGAVYDRHGGLTRDEAVEIVDAILHTVKASLAEGRPVSIRNFGVFEIQQRKGRRGVNPATGDPMDIRAGKGLRFRPSDGLKREVGSGSERRGSRSRRAGRQG